MQKIEFLFRNIYLGYCIPVENCLYYGHRDRHLPPILQYRGRVHTSQSRILQEFTQYGTPRWLYPCGLGEFLCF